MRSIPGLVVQNFNLGYPVDLLSEWKLVPNACFWGSCYLVVLTFATVLFAMVVHIRYTPLICYLWSDFIMFVSTVLCLRFVNLPVLWSSYNRRKLFWSYDVSVQIAWLCSLHLRCIQPTVFLFYIKLAPVSASSIFLLQKISTSQPNTGWYGCDRSGLLVIQSPSFKFSR